VIRQGQNLTRDQQPAEPNPQNRRILLAMLPAKPTTPLRSDVLILSALSAFLVIAHFLMGNGYGFHRDELQFLDDARHLQWGFVAYPPMTSFFGRMAIALFGISVQVLRLPAALVNAVSLVLAGLMARELGGNRASQVVALLLSFPLALAFSSVLQYNTFDLLAWSILILSTAKVLRTGDERYWIGAGLGLGLGVLSKYAIAFPLVSLLPALVALPSQRHHLKSRWFWLGALLATIIAAPNLLWLARHHFITLQMEHYVHLRDVRIGRAKGFFTDQIKFAMFGLPFAVGGLVALLRNPQFRLLSAFYIGPLVLLALVKGRGYYMLPAYAVVYAAGAVGLENWLASRAKAMRGVLYGLVLAAVLLEIAAVAWAALPIWRPGSAGWKWQMKNNDDMANEVGWPEFVAQVAAVRDSLTPSERSQYAVLAENYGEAGALELYGPKYGLPVPISTVNDFHDRGYGSFEPQTLIVVGGNLEDESKFFEGCSVVATVHLPYGVQDEESADHPQILICHHMRFSWPVVWARSQDFG
jgi:4-amino-4-deoxy-L-arabinose transferase-like glycosyltransferase